jgi:hypothetical protein
MILKINNIRCWNVLEGVGSCWTVGTLEVVLQVWEMEIYFFFDG